MQKIFMKKTHQKANKEEDKKGGKRRRNYLK